MYLFSCYNFRQQRLRTTVLKAFAFTLMWLSEEAQDVLLNRWNYSLWRLLFFVYLLKLFEFLAHFMLLPYCNASSLNCVEPQI